MKKERIIILFTDEQMLALRGLSSKTDAPIGALVRRAVGEFLERRGINGSQQND